MDKSASEITFDSKGVCNFCRQMEEALCEVKLEKHNLKKRIEQVKKDGQGRKYDCLAGLSGGVDSAMTLHYLVKADLRPLCFSLDNGYGDNRASENVIKMVKKLGVDFLGERLNLRAFRELQASFIKAGVKNIEIPSDHVLMAFSYQLASKHKIKWIFSGGNVNSEGVMPPSWGYQPRDLRHIKDIHRKSLKDLPTCGLLKFNYYKWIKGIKVFYPLDYIDYNRIEAEKFLEKEYDFVSTGGKHEENYFTKWFQNYYLYERYGIDKRKAFYSSLINAGQMTRKEAMQALQKCPEYPTLGKLDIEIYKNPRRSHYQFKTNEKLFNFISKVIKLCRKIKNGILNGRIL